MKEMMMLCLWFVGVCLCLLSLSSYEVGEGVICNNGNILIHFLFSGGGGVSNFFCCLCKENFVYIISYWYKICASIFVKLGYFTLS